MTLLMKEVVSSGLLFWRNPNNCVRVSEFHFVDFFGVNVWLKRWWHTVPVKEELETWEYHQRGNEPSSQQQRRAWGSSWFDSVGWRWGVRPANCIAAWMSCQLKWNQDGSTDWLTPDWQSVLMKPQQGAASASFTSASNSSHPITAHLSLLLRVLLSRQRDVKNVGGNGDRI